MAWRDNLREASYRGVKFYYHAVESTVGRRTVVHRFPDRDDVEVEDLGRSAQEFNLDAYVLGDDYDAARDRLISAFESPDGGYLVHPYWGTRFVTPIGPVAIRETPKEQGMARISVRVIESGPVLTPARSVDTAAAVSDAADATNDAAKDVFADADTGWSLDSAIQNAVDNAEDALNTAYTAITDAKRDVNSALGIVDEVITEITSAVSEISSLVSSPSTIAETVTGFCASTMASVSEVTAATADLIATGADLRLPFSAGPTSARTRSDVLLQALSALNAFDADGATVLGTGTQSVLEENAIDATIRIVRVAAATEAARSASELTFDSFDKAFEVLESITGVLDNLADTASDDLEFKTLRDLRRALAQHIYATAADLPRIVDYTVPDTMPALVIAHRLYGDATRADEIIARNNIRNPAAVVGGTVLQVLTDA